MRRSGEAHVIDPSHLGRLARLAYNLPQGQRGGEKFKDKVMAVTVFLPSVLGGATHPADAEARQHLPHNHLIVNDLQVCQRRTPQK